MGSMEKAAAGIAIALLALAPTGAAEAKSAKPAGACVLKAAEGTGPSEAGAKFQVDEALLQSVDWGAWASWMSSGTTPGYSYGPRKYSCKGGSGLGYTCRGQSTICKL